MHGESNSIGEGTYFSFLSLESKPRFPGHEVVNFIQFGLRKKRKQELTNGRLGGQMNEVHSL
jgi:hypothetical protein